MFADCLGKSGRKLKYDFYIPSKNLLIEFDGPQHFGYLKIGKHTLSINEYEKLKLNDTIKNKYAYENNIKLLRIPYTEIKNVNNILKSSRLISDNISS